MKYVGVDLHKKVISLCVVMQKAGQRIVVAGDLTAFAAIYGAAIPVQGPFTGQLANGGELLRVFAANGAIIASLTYGDSAPWPPGADVAMALPGRRRLVHRCAVFDGGCCARLRRPSQQQSLSKRLQARGRRRAPREDSQMGSVDRRAGV